MGKHNNTTNSGRHPYMRNDLWANGHFDLLFKQGISDNYRARLNAFKEDAIESRKMINNHYPSIRK